MRIKITLLALITLFFVKSSFAQAVIKYRASACYWSTSKEANGTPIWVKIDNASNILVVLDEPKEKISIYSKTIQDLSIIARYSMGADSAIHLYQYHMNCVDQDNKKCDADLTLYRGTKNEHLVQLIINYYTIEYKFDMRPDE